MGMTLTWRKSLTLTSTQKTPWEEFLWAERSHEENPWLLWRYTDDIMGRIPMGETLTWRKSTAPLTSTQKTLWAEFLWAKRLHKEKIPDFMTLSQKDTMGRIPLGETLTWRKPTALLTSARKTPWPEFLWANAHMKKTTAPPMLTQKTLWAEFLWAKRLYKKKNPWLSWHLHRRLRGQNSYGRMLTWKKTALLDISTEDSMGGILMGERSHEENHGSTDVNTEDTMGRIPMGETLTWRKPTALLTSARKTPWAEFLWANAHMKKTTAPPMLTQKTLWAEFLWAKRLYKKKNPWLPWHLHRRLRGQNSYGRMLTWRKKTALLDISTEDSMGGIPMGERSHEEKPRLHRC